MLAVTFVGQKYQLETLLLCWMLKCHLTDDQLKILAMKQTSQSNDKMQTNHKFRDRVCQKVLGQFSDKALLEHKFTNCVSIIDQWQGVTKPPLSNGCMEGPAFWCSVR